MSLYMIRRVVAVALAAAVVFATCVPAAFSVEALDAYEGSLGDNTSATARDVTRYLSVAGGVEYVRWFGSAPRTELHDFGWVQDETSSTPAASDEDWIKFEVDAVDYSFGSSVLIEAVATSPLVDPVIEVYGPNGAVPTAPGDLGESSAVSGATELDPNAVDANDDGIWFSDRSASVSFVPQDVGWYYVRVRPYYQYIGGTFTPGFRNGVGAYKLRMKVGQTTRVSGDDRIATSVAISQERYPSQGPAKKTVVLANAYAFPDALSGSTLAGAVEGPILLTAGTGLSSAARAEIVRLKAEKVYLLGGTSALSSSVESAVKAITVDGHPVQVARLPGSDRTDTARLVAREAARVSDTSHLAFIVSSTTFPDALAASSMAAYNRAPVLLTSKDTLSAGALRALNDPDLDITDVVIVGGSAVVSWGVQSQIAGILGSSNHVKRIYGNTRYITARNFAVWATGWEAGPSPATHVDVVGTKSNGDELRTLDFDRIALVSGENFPDALAGGPFAGLARAPILLTTQKAISPYVLEDLDPVLFGTNSDYYHAAPYEFKRCYIIGGSSAVSDSVFEIWDAWTGPSPY